MSRHQTCARPVKVRYEFNTVKCKDGENRSLFPIVFCTNNTSTINWGLLETEPTNLQEWSIGEGIHALCMLETRDDSGSEDDSTKLKKTRRRSIEAKSFAAGSTKTAVGRVGGSRY